jgi:hypothetical protein
MRDRLLLFPKKSGPRKSHYTKNFFFFGYKIFAAAGKLAHHWFSSQGMVFFLYVSKSIDSRQAL